MVGARRSRSIVAEENRSITPEEPSRSSPRSRKCLNLNSTDRPSPLAERNRNGWSRDEVTPLKGEKRKNLEENYERAEDEENVSDDDREPSPEPPSDIFAPTPAPFSVAAYTPISTPRSLSRHLGSMQKSIMIAVPRRRSTPNNTAFILDQFRVESPRSVKKPAKEETFKSPVSSIGISSFYSGKAATNQPDEVTASGDKDKRENGDKVDENQQRIDEKKKNEEVKAYVDLVRRRKDSKRLQTRAVRRKPGGLKRRGDGVNRGVFGHAIKKPKKKLRVNIKISDIKATSIEIPGSKNASKTPKSPKSPSTPVFKPAKPIATTLTPKLGNFSLTKETAVDYEVKGGQIVYRKSTPRSAGQLRRSPRKHMSPLKASYFHGTKPRPRSSGKLFSPSADFLLPEQSSPVKHIPSPVKFSVSTDDDSQEDDEEEEERETNISDIIHRLGEEEGDDCEEMDSDLCIDPGLQLDLVAGNIVSSQFVDTDPTVAAFTAVKDILGDMPSSESDGSMSQSMEENNVEASDKLFPIFYKESAQHGANKLENLASSGRPRRHVCNDPNQLQIDAGQNMGPTLCVPCGTVYSKGDADDEANHEKLHNGVMERLRYPGWRKERNCGEHAGGHLVMIQPGDPRHMWKKVEDVLAIVDRELGFSEIGIRSPEKTKVFLYVTEKKVGGLLLAESIPSGYRVITDKKETGRVVMSSEDPVPVVCGISRVWVSDQCRRQGVASALVDAMRKLFLLGKYLGEDDFAFSDPTPDGMSFAETYMKRSDFLVYSR